MFGAALVAVALLGGAVATGEPPPVSRSHAAVETAAATTWSVTPGGSFSVIGTNVVIRFGGIELVCEGAVAEGFAPSGPGIGNPLAEFPDRPGFVFSNCQGPFGLSFDLTQVGTIELHADSYDAATDRMTGRLTNVGFDVSAPGCRVTVTGHLDIVYDNPGAELRTLPNLTLAVSSVDPVESCAGLVAEGDPGAVEGAFAFTPAQRFAPD